MKERGSVKKLIFIVLAMYCVLVLNGCSQKEPSVVNIYYAVSATEVARENDELIFFVTHYEMSDGTWKTDKNTYKYRLEITGRMNAAAKDSTFVYLSNIKDITFDQAWKAAGLSSNMDDYFDEDVAQLVGIKQMDACCQRKGRKMITNIKIHIDSYTRGVKENMYWMSIEDFDKHKVFPSWLKDYLSREHNGIEHIVTDER